MPHSLLKLPFKAQYGKGKVIKNTTGSGLLLRKGLGNSYDSLDQYRELVPQPKGKGLSTIIPKLENLMMKPLKEKSKLKNIQFPQI
jgi:hypothetical protein